MWLGRVLNATTNLFFWLAMLEFTADLRRPNSRLSCQIELTDALDGLTVDLPATQY